MANTPLNNESVTEINELLKLINEYRENIEPYAASTNNNYIIQAAHLISIIDLLVKIIRTYLHGEEGVPSALEELQNHYDNLVNNQLKYSRLHEGQYRFKTNLANGYEQLDGKLGASHIQLTNDDNNDPLTGEMILIDNKQGALSISDHIVYVKNIIDSLIKGTIQVGKFETLVLKTLNQDLMSGISIKNLNVGTNTQDTDHCTSFDQVVCFNMPLENGTEILSFDKEFACGDYSLGIRLRLATNNVTRGLDGGTLKVEAFNGNIPIGSWNVKRGRIISDQYQTIHIPITHNGSVEIENDGINNKTVFNRNLSVRITALDSYQSGDVLYVDYVSVSPTTIAVYDEVGTNNIQVGE